MAERSVPVAVTLPRIDQPLFDRASGLVTEPWYRYFESTRNRIGGDTDLVDGTKVAASVADDKAQEANEDVADLRTNEVVAGNGLEGGGAIGDGVRIDAKQDDGWVPSTGAGDKTTPYAVPAPFTVSNPPTQAEVQAIATALLALSARYVALEAALLANESLTV